MASGNGHGLGRYFNEFSCLRRNQKAISNWTSYFSSLFSLLLMWIHISSVGNAPHWSEMHLYWTCRRFPAATAYDLFSWSPIISGNMCHFRAYHLKPIIVCAFFSPLVITLSASSFCIYVCSGRRHCRLTIFRESTFFVFVLRKQYLLASNKRRRRRKGGEKSAATRCPYIDDDRTTQNNRFVYFFMKRLPVEYYLIFT